MYFKKLNQNQNNNSQNPNSQFGFFQQQQNPQPQDFLSSRQNVFLNNKNRNSFSEDENGDYKLEKEDLTQDIDELKYLVKETEEDNQEINLEDYLKYRNGLN